MASQDERKVVYKSISKPLIWKDEDEVLLNSKRDEVFSLSVEVLRKQSEVQFLTRQISHIKTRLDSSNEQILELNRRLDTLNEHILELNRRRLYYYTFVKSGK